MATSTHGRLRDCGVRTVVTMTTEHSVLIPIETGDFNDVVAEPALILRVKPIEALRRLASQKRSRCATSSTRIPTLWATWITTVTANSCCGLRYTPPPRHLKRLRLMRLPIA